MIWNFVRHGQTDWNAMRLFQGGINIPLNETGKKQAREAGEALKKKGIRFVRVYSSPMIRAMETACLISSFPMEEVITDDRLAEIDLGHMEGASFDQVDRRNAVMFYQPEAFSFSPEMEPYDRVIARAASFLSDLKKEADETDDHILIQTHGACMRAIRSVLGHLPAALFWGQRIGNCELMRYRCDGKDKEIVPVDEEKNGSWDAIA